MEGNGGDGGRRERERETGRVANTQPHQTTHPISERWMREAADCNSSPPALQISLSLLHLFLRAFHLFSAFTKKKKKKSPFLISRCLLCSVCVTSCPWFPLSSLFSFLSAFLSHFISHFTLTPPSTRARVPFLSLNLSSLPLSSSPPRSCEFSAK